MKNPKEEPKRTHYLDELPNIDKDTLAKMWEATKPRVEPKQETLEKDLTFPLIIENGMDYLNLTTKIFNNGAKWQQERMYSEKEVESLLHKFMQHRHPDWHGWSTTKWFEQFKKKQQ